MARRWIVDSSNVMGSRPDGWWRDRPAALARLVDEIVRWRAEAGEPVVVVADGHPTASVPEAATYGVEVRYAHSTARDAADDDIVGLVGADPSPGQVAVVTSDRALRVRVQALGASVEGSGRFLDRLAHVETRRHDRAVLARFGVEETDLLGRGGEARVFALDDERVLRLPHPGTDPDALDDRRDLLEAIAVGDAPVALPAVLEHREVGGRTVVIERRLPGRDAIEVLGATGTNRAALVRHHLDVADAVRHLPCPATCFGELWGAGALTAETFAAWATARLTASLREAPPAFGSLDPGRLTADLVAALPEPEPERPLLVHLDVFLGNLLADGDRVTALLDFGPMTIGGPAHLDPLVAIAYLHPAITPTATEGDRAVAETWAAERGLAAAVGAVERWIAAYWTGARDDQHLQRWCAEILLPRRDL